MSRPVSLTIAVILQWIGAAIVLVLGIDLVIAAMAMSDRSVADEVEAALISQGITDFSGALVVISVLLAGVLVSAIALVRILLALYLWRGRNWARIVLTVLVVLNLLGGATYFSQGHVLRALLTIVLDLAILYFMFNAQSSAYIAARSAERRGPVPS